MPYLPAPERYTTMEYRNAGRSGLKLPVLSLGLWQNFGESRDYDSGFRILSHAFDNGITHFDLANNYGPPPGAAEVFFGQILAREFRPYRDEMIVSSKAGYRMWDGPYGEWGSRKNLIASCDQSLARMGLDYVDVFYSHRYDPNTPLEETMAALADLVRAGKALYVGISNYPVEETRAAQAILKSRGTPAILHQPSYSMLNRWIELDGTLDEAHAQGMGIIAFSPLAQGILSGKYNGAAPSDARGHSGNPFLKADAIRKDTLEAVQKLGALAEQRGQSMPQMALSWMLHKPQITSALIGIRTLEQLQDNLGAVNGAPWTAEELALVEAATATGRIDNKPRW